MTEQRMKELSAVAHETRLQCRCLKCERRWFETTMVGKSYGALYEDIVCTCGASTQRGFVYYRGVKARITDHVCDARCTHAKGVLCECSCGGKNHGSMIG